MTFALIQALIQSLLIQPLENLFGRSMQAVCRTVGPGVLFGSDPFVMRRAAGKRKMMWTAFNDFARELRTFVVGSPVARRCAGGEHD